MAENKASVTDQDESIKGPEVGEPAPDFNLPAAPDRKVSLRDFRGKRVVLAFYPADWSPVCSNQLAGYNALVPDLKRLNAELVGISVDGVWCHGAFAKDRKFQFPLLADFKPQGEVARAYGVYREPDGISERALFVIDEEGIVRWRHISPIGENPGSEGIIQALQSH